MAEEALITFVSMVSMAVIAIYVLVGVVFATIFGKKLSSEDFWILVWVVFDVLIHLTLEGPFVAISLVSTVNNSSHFTALTWKEYAKADFRWGVSDPTIVSLEILTVTFVEVCAVLLCYAMIKNKYYRHYVQIVLCVCELYGGWMTFAPEWLTGSKNLDTSNVVYLWLYLFFFNMLWVIIPIYMLWQSWRVLKVILSGDGELITEKQETTVTTNVVRTYNTRSKAKQGKDE